MIQAYQINTRPPCSPWGKPEPVTKPSTVTAQVNIGALHCPNWENVQVDTARGVDIMGWFVVWPIGTDKNEQWYFAKREDMRNVRVFSGV